MLVSIVLVALAFQRNRQLRSALRDRQLTGCQIGIRIPGVIRGSRYFTECAVVIRRFRCVDAVCRRVRKRDRIIREGARNGDLFRIILAIAVLRLAVILNSLIRDSDRQRQGVVDGDDIAICSDCDLAGRIVAVIGQILALIRRCGFNGDRTVTLADRNDARVTDCDRRTDHSTARISRLDLDIAAQELVINGVLRHIQLPDSVQRNNSAISGRQILDSLFISISRRRSVFVCVPTDELIVRAGKSIGRQRLFHVIREALIRHRAGSIRGVLIELHGIVDRLPHSEEIIIRLIFVGRNLRCSVTGSIRVARAGPNEEVSGRTALGLGPALEGIAFTGLRTKDINSLVDLEVLVGTIPRALAIVLAAVVAVPIDMGRSVLLDLDVLRTQLDRIGRLTDLGMGRVLCRTGVSGVVRVDPLGNNDLGVILQHVESCAGIHMNVSVLIFARCFVPLLDDPVIKTILCAVFSLGCGDGRGRGMILVLMGIRTCGAFYSFPLVVKAVSGINKTDTLGAFKNLTPLGVELHLADDPEAVFSRIFVVAGPFGVTPLVKLSIFGLGISRRCLRCQSDLIADGVLESGVAEPADKLILVAQALREADLGALSVLEAHFDVAAPGECGILLAVIQHRVGMHEDTVFLLDPLGVDAHTVLRHSGEGARLHTRAVKIPAFKHEAFDLGGLIILLAVLVVSRHVRIVGNAGLFLQRPCTRRMVDRRSFVGHIDAVKIGEFVFVAGIVELDGVIIAVIKQNLPIAAVNRIRRALRKACDWDEVLVLSGIDTAIGIDSHMLMQIITYAVICHVAGRAGQRLDIIVHVDRRSRAVLHCFEDCILIRHGLE